AERSVSGLLARMQAASPRHAVERSSSTVDELGRRLQAALSTGLEQRGRGLSALHARLAASSHESILARGFSITRLKRTRQIVTDPAMLRANDRVTTQTA